MNSHRNSQSRRDFLRLCGLAGLGVAAPITLSRTVLGQDAVSPPYDGPYYVVFNAAGGCDTTYLMDPKGINGMNLLYQEGDILTQGAHKFAPTDKHKSGGMSNEEFYKEFGSELLVVNGIDYSVNNHLPGARYMATGKLDSLAYPTFAALAAACKGSTCPLSFLSFGNYSNTGNLVAMSRINYLPSLQKFAYADCVEGQTRNPYHEDFALDRLERALKEQTDAAISKTALPRVERAESMLYAAQLNSKALQRVAPYIPSSIPKERLSGQAEIALASFKAGVCVSANLSIGQFDSHSNNDRDQMKLIPELLAGIAYLLRRAEELKIRDKIVIVAQSDMGRTPTYNKGEGKDHWSIGSAFFLGPGIRGNRVVGATDEKQMSVSVDPSTLAIDREHGQRIRPEHLHIALRQYAGISEHAMSKQFPLVVPEKEQLGKLWG
jgi:hypothetical protein